MRIALTPGYVLHGRPYRETSLLLDVFSREHGRQGLVARGVRKKNSGRYALLQPYQRLVIAWSGKAELHTLTDVEADNTAFGFTGRRLITAFYLNELLTRLLHQGDPHPVLFDGYEATLRELHQSDSNEAMCVRFFEKRLLDAIGYGPVLDRDIDQGKAIAGGEHYYYCADSGAWCQKPHDTACIEVSGDMLLALKNETAMNDKLLRECKMLMRYLLHKHIGNKPLESRRLYRSYIANSRPNTRIAN